MNYIYRIENPKNINFAEFAEKRGYSGNVVLKYMLFKLITAENIFSLSCEKHIVGRDKGLYRLAVNEIEEIIEEFKNYHANPVFKSYIPVNPSKDDFTEQFLNFKSAEDLTEMLAEYYAKRGCGEFSLYRGFRLMTGAELVPVKIFDPITFENLFCYESQFRELKANTEAFIKGKPARNTLLFGARGTGKSSSVKALVNTYFDKGLRLIETPKERLHLLPEVMHKLAGRGYRFIIFIDDLSFEAEETSYKYLKSVLEGSAESRPDNVIFYATSNRRHLIAEKWEDRGDISQKGDMHTQDQLNEKMSLSDRFGLQITFTRPDVKQYINIVKSIAEERGIVFDEKMEQRARAYELYNGGRSGRIAKQFIESELCGGDL